MSYTRRYLRTFVLLFLFTLAVSIVQFYRHYPRHSFLQSVANMSGQNPVANYSDSRDKIELQMMHEYLKSRPRLLKAFIYLLVQASRKEMLMRLLNQLHTNFNHRYGYPVLLFHEADFQPLRSQLRANNAWGNQLFFQTVHFKLPEFHEKRFGPADNLKFCRWGVTLGYRHMCRFHSIVLYEQPALQGLEYYWRLDDDSQLLRPIAADIFQVLRDSDAEYGYFQATLDNPLCTYNLWNLTRRFITEHQLRPTFFDKIPENFQFFNNFEVSRMRLWRSPQYRSFMDAIDQEGGIYRYRWGDAPIKTLALSLFVRLEKIAMFIDIGYEHPGQSWRSRLALLEQLKLSANIVT